MKTDTRHDCPGQCGRKVSRAMLACYDDWHRLPEDLRHAVSRADAIRRRSPDDPDRIRAHRQAVVACIAWYRANIGATS